MRRNHTISLAVTVAFFIALVPAAARQKSGLMRFDGTWIVEPYYGRFEKIGSDRFMYWKKNSDSEDYSVWVVDSRGIPVRIKEPEGAAPFVSTPHGGPTIAQLNPEQDEKVLYYFNRKGKTGLVSETGKVIIDAEFDHIGDVSEGHVIAQREYSVFIFSVPDGKLVSQTSSAWVRVSGRGKFVGGLAEVREGIMRGFIDFEGKLVIPCRYNFARALGKGLVQVDYICDPKATPPTWRSEIINKHGLVNRLPSRQDLKFIDSKPSPI